MTETDSKAPRRWLGLSAVLAATIMNLLDTNVVNVAAPAIRADLGGSYADLQWFAAAYTLAMAVGLLTGGRLGDLFGRRRALLVGVVGFVAASLACSLAWSPGALIGARMVQGLAGALMVPQGFGLIRDLFPPREMGRAFAVFGPAIGLSTILGPVVAGLLIHADLFGTGWRAVFAINAPVGLYALLAGRRALPAGRRAPGAVRLDVAGVLLAGTGMLLLVYPLVQGRQAGWPAWSFLMLAAAVAVLGAFAGYQVRRRRSGRTPLVELSVLARRSYTSGVLFVVVFFGALAGFGLAVGLFLQLGLGYSPVRASLAMAAWAVGAFLGTGVGSTMTARLGRRILHLGLAVMAIGLAGVFVVLDRSGPGVTGWHLAAPLLVYGAGMGMIFAPLFDIIMGEVGDHEVGSAAGLLESVQQLGASLGVAVLGSVYFAAVGPRPAAPHRDLGGFLDASRLVTLVTIGLTGLAFAVGFLLPVRGRQHTTAPEPSTVDDREPALV
jgi:EmrB/QacA subfamily drug resistance transporter